MKWTWDSRVAGLYIELSAGASVRTTETLPGVMLDFDANGSVVGVEVLGPTRSVSIDPALFGGHEVEDEDQIRLVIAEMERAPRGKIERDSQTPPLGQSVTSTDRVLSLAPAG